MDVVAHFKGARNVSSIPTGLRTMNQRLKEAISEVGVHGRRPQVANEAVLTI